MCRGGENALSLGPVDMGAARRMPGRVGYHPIADLLVLALFLMKVLGFPAFEMPLVLGPFPCLFIHPPISFVFFSFFLSLFSLVISSHFLVF